MDWTQWAAISIAAAAVADWGTLIVVLALKARRLRKWNHKLEETMLELAERLAKANMDAARMRGRVQHWQAVAEGKGALLWMAGPITQRLRPSPN